MNRMNANYHGQPAGKSYKGTGNKQTGKPPSRIVTEYQESDSYAQAVRSDALDSVISAAVTAALMEYQKTELQTSHQQQYSKRENAARPASNMVGHGTRKDAPPQHRFVKTGDGNKRQTEEEEQRDKNRPLIAEDGNHYTHKVYVHGFQNNHTATERKAMVMALAAECKWKLDRTFMDGFVADSNNWQLTRLGQQDHNEAAVIVTLSNETAYNRKAVHLEVEVPLLGIRKFTLNYLTPTEINMLDTDPEKPNEPKAYSFLSYAKGCGLDTEELCVGMDALNRYLCTEGLTPILMATHATNWKNGIVVPIIQIFVVKKDDCKHRQDCLKRLGMDNTPGKTCESHQMNFELFKTVRDALYGTMSGALLAPRKIYKIGNANRTDKGTIFNAMGGAGYNLDEIGFIFQSGKGSDTTIWVGVTPAACNQYQENAFFLQCQTANLLISIVKETPAIKLWRDSVNKSAPRGKVSAMTIQTSNRQSLACSNEAIQSPPSDVPVQEKLAPAKVERTLTEVTQPSLSSTPALTGSALTGLPSKTAMTTQDSVSREDFITVLIVEQLASFKKEMISEIKKETTVMTKILASIDEKLDAVSTQLSSTDQLVEEYGGSVLVTKTNSGLANIIAQNAEDLAKVCKEIKVLSSSSLKTSNEMESQRKTLKSLARNVTTDITQASPTKKSPLRKPTPRISKKVPSSPSEKKPSFGQSPGDDSDATDVQTPKLETPSNGSRWVDNELSTQRPSRSNSKSPPKKTKSPFKQTPLKETNLMRKNPFKYVPVNLSPLLGFLNSNTLVEDRRSEPKKVASSPVADSNIEIKEQIVIDLISTSSSDTYSDTSSDTFSDISYDHELALQQCECDVVFPQQPLSSMALTEQAVPLSQRFIYPGDSVSEEIHSQCSSDYIPSTPKLDALVNKYNLVVPQEVSQPIEHSQDGFRMKISLNTSKRPQCNELDRNCRVGISAPLVSMSEISIPMKGFCGLETILCCRDMLKLSAEERENYTYASPEPGKKCELFEPMINSLLEQLMDQQESDITIKTILTKPELIASKQKLQDLLNQIRLEKCQKELPHSYWLTLTEFMLLAQKTPVRFWTRGRAKDHSLTLETVSQSSYWGSNHLRISEILNISHKHEPVDVLFDNGHFSVIIIKGMNTMKIVELYNGAMEDNSA
jgi:hypothetical protein